MIKISYTPSPIFSASLMANNSVFAKTIEDDQTTKLAKDIKAKFFVSTYEDINGDYLISPDNNLLYDTPASYLHAGNNRLFLNEKAVKIIEKEMLDGGKFPDEMYQNFATVAPGKEARSYGRAIRLDKLIEYLISHE